MCNKEAITKMVRGELTCMEAEQLYKKLYSRNDRMIIDDLKELELKSLLNTEEAIENFLDTMSELEDNEENKSSIEQSKRSLEFIEIAITEKIDLMISAEKQVKEILCN